MKNRKILIPITILLLVGIAVALQKFDISNFSFLPFSESSTSSPSAEQKKQEDAANAEIKQELIEKGDDRQESSTTSPQSIELEARQETNETVTVLTKLSGFSRGDCVLTVQNGTRTNEQTAKVIYQEEYSSCAGFSVPIDSLGKGQWQIKLIISSEGATVRENIMFEVR